MGKADMAAGRSFTTVDVMRVRVDSPADGVRTFIRSEPTPVVECDALICGGGVGGIAAALSLSGRGLRVCLTEETDWLGGQMTAQGVSALDENRFVETSGAARSYQHLREAIRAHYRPFAGAEPALSPRLNPGDSWVSWLSFEPKVALAKINELIAPAVEAGTLSVHLRHRCLAAAVSDGAITAVTAVDLDTGSFVEFRPRVCLDATELGDIIAAAGADYRTGSESRSQTGEPHAPETGDRDNVQDFTYPFVIEWRPGESHVIEKPPHFERFESVAKFSFQGYRMFSTARRAEADGHEVELLPFWEYRRLIHKELLPGSPHENDLSMINWDSNDLRGENIIDQSPSAEADRLALGKAVSLGFLYWLQTEAPRDDGGTGYPELMLRPDILGSTDGLSKYPYIRESRRIKALTTIVEQDIAAATNAGARARAVDDTIGIGHYPIDIHGHQEVPGAAQAARPFQIPMGALIAGGVKNLLASGKNIGTTHITNGAYRLHPIEWAVGLAAGLIAAAAVETGAAVADLRSNKERLRAIQRALVEGGSPIYWYDDVSTSHDHFAAIQYVSIAGIIGGTDSDLHFRPEDRLTDEEAEAAVARLAPEAQKLLVGDPGFLPADFTRARFAGLIYQILRQPIQQPV